MDGTLVLLITLIVALSLFVWNYWRYDVVAVFTLMVLVLTGTVPFSAAFSGFANPAVITVACVMVLTQAIMQTGVIDYFVKKLDHFTHHAMLHIASLCFIVAILSAFMNNIGALALIMPVAMQTALKSKHSPTLLLMPIAFSSVLGGLTTVIGTPPNLLISAYRQDITGQPFNMFDFTPVGIVLALCGILFISIIGWRLLPQGRTTPKQLDDLFQVHDYITEAKIPEKSPVVGLTRRELEQFVKADFLIIGLIRGKKKRLVIHPEEMLLKNDILIIQASHDDLEKLLHEGKLQLVADKKVSRESLRTNNVSLLEAVVPNNLRIEGRSAQNLRLRTRYRINLLAIARQGTAFKSRLNHIKLRAGDVVLLQGDAESLQEEALSLGFLPLIERGVKVGLPRQAILPILIFTIVVFLASLQILPIQIAFTLGVLSLVLLNIIPARRLYEHIDWSIVVLLGAMIPVGTAMQLTGTTQHIATLLVHFSGNMPVFVLLGILMVITMTLSDVMNNTATAVVMAPIAISVARLLEVNIDTFLMAIAVGASSSFLTPISHQNNILVMGPGGYKFTDYFRLGLPLEILIILIGLPMILFVWPL